MRIEQLLQKDIFRPINGVVKADQLDAASIWQELDEFVVTRELDQHLRKFFSAYSDAIDRPHDPDVAGTIGVWVSGFFGSGKSHFIKVLSYLLHNQVHTYHGQNRRAVEFFEGKINDAMLLGDIKRAVAANTEVILFNIDSKADTKAGREAILAVFLKVLNELEGYCADHPHIAHLERYLESRGRLDTFCHAFRVASGREWRQERDAYHFHHDAVVEAWSLATGQSQDAAENWIEGAEDSFALSVENFCKWVQAYLDKRGPAHRLIFLVDEVGQFIGADTHLMLNLQTLVENLGTVCQGRAWVVVTSQEDIDAVLGEMKRSRANDFSKIQGRFRIRLSLSSTNVDEVIQERLLIKRADVIDDLSRLFSEKGDIIKHQLTFTNVGMTFKAYRDADDFVKNYPFAPYQFQLVQKIFEAIRKAGATGLHLSRGERSVLDAFQSAGKAVANRDVGILVPLYEFYPAIESFLDTAIKKTIDQAADNSSLEPFDVKLLQVLFLIRYVDEIKGTVDHLVTLCLDQIDADRLALRRQIEASLQRLEQETLISRSGDHYFFLTNEERDINREIKSVELSSGEEARLLGELLFEDVFKGLRKYRYPVNKMDFSFNRLCDRFPVGNRVDGALLVTVITPLADEYELYREQRCVLESSQEGGQVLIRLDDHDSLGRELRTFLRTDKYSRTRNDGTLPPSTKRILHDLAADNRTRRERLAHWLGNLLTTAGYFVAGQRFQNKAAGPQTALDQALEYLVRNTFSKMGYLRQLSDNSLQEIQAVLRSNDIGQQMLALQGEEGNRQAIDDLRSYIELCTKTSRPIVLHDLVERRYALRPYGWPEWEVILLLARLFVLGEISLMLDGALIPLERAYEALSTTAKWRKITVIQRKTADPKALQVARQLGKEVFSVMGPDGEDPLVAFLRERLDAWKTQLGGYKVLADAGGYPGQEEINDSLTLIGVMLAGNESYTFIARFNERRDDLLDLADDFHDLEHFYEHQKPAWEKLRKAYAAFQLNRLELEKDGQAGPALKRMQEILMAASPYGLIKEADALISTVDEVNAALLSGHRAQALAKIDTHIARLNQDIAAAQGEASLQAACLKPLETLKEQVQKEESLAHITQAEGEAIKEFDAAIGRIEEFLRNLAEQQKPKDDGSGQVSPPPSGVKKQRIIKPADLVQTTYLESSADVNSFLDTLRRELEQAIANHERIQIR